MDALQDHQILLYILVFNTTMLGSRRRVQHVVVDVAAVVVVVLCQLSKSFYLPRSIVLTHFLIWEAGYCFYVIYSIIHLSCFPLLCNAAVTN